MICKLASLQSADQPPDLLGMAHNLLLTISSVVFCQTGTAAPMSFAVDLSQGCCLLLRRHTMNEAQPGRSIDSSCLQQQRDGETAMPRQLPGCLCRCGHWRAIPGAEAGAAGTPAQEAAVPCPQHLSKLWQCPGSPCLCRMPYAWGWPLPLCQPDSSLVCRPCGQQ